MPPSFGAVRRSLSALAIASVTVGFVLASPASGAPLAAQYFAVNGTCEMTVTATPSELNPGLWRLTWQTDCSNDHAHSCEARGSMESGFNDWDRCPVLYIEGDTAPWGYPGDGREARIGRTNGAPAWFYGVQRTTVG